MERKIIEDITPPDNKKTVRNIPIPNRSDRPFGGAPKEQFVKKPPLKKFGDNKSAFSPPPTIPSIVISRVERPWWRRVWPAFLVVFFAIFGYGAYLFFHIEAIVTVIPKERVATVNHKFTAKKNPLPSEIPFEVMTIEEEGGKTIPATGEKTVEKRSSGKVIIYNNYNTQSQRLIKNTRLQTPEGLIFRIESSVVVPGQIKKNGELVPGSVEVLVNADAPGEDYNIPLSDFTIPGFKGDPRYEYFYARSKTTMSGGFKGLIKVASEAERNLAEKEIILSLKEKLLKQAKLQVPADFVLFDKASYIVTEPMSIPESVDVKIKVTLQGIMFNRNSLSESIAAASIPEYFETGEKVYAVSLETLNFSPDSLEVSPWDTGNLPFTLSGTTTIRWIVDEEKFKKDLAGIPKIKFDEILPLHHSIESATVRLQPPWKGTLPEDPSRITILLQNRGQN